MTASNLGTVISLTHNLRQVCAIESEDVGHDGNPLVISWKRKPRVSAPAEKELIPTLTKQPLSSTMDNAGHQDHQDYESIVLARLQRAEEQRRSSSTLKQ